MGRAIAAILGSSETAQYRSFGRPFAAIGDTIAAFWQELIRDAVRPYRPAKYGHLPTRLG